MSALENFLSDPEEQEELKKVRNTEEDDASEEAVFEDTRLSETFQDGFEDEDDENWMEFDEEIDDLN